MDETRERTLAVHRELRQSMREVLAIYRRVAGGGGEEGEGSLLYTCTCRLAEVVERQVAFEQAELAPLLATLDAWGSIREEQLETVHEHEREAVARATSDGPGSTPIPAAARCLVAELLRMLRWEERHLLHADLLRDDSIITDQSGG